MEKEMETEQRDEKTEGRGRNFSLWGRKLSIKLHNAVKILETEKKKKRFVHCPAYKGKLALDGHNPSTSHTCSFEFNLLQQKVP